MVRLPAGDREPGRQLGLQLGRRTKHEWWFLGRNDSAAVRRGLCCLLLIFIAPVSSVLCAPAWLQVMGRVRGRWYHGAVDSFEVDSGRVKVICQDRLVAQSTRCMSARPDCGP